MVVESGRGPLPQWRLKLDLCLYCGS